MKHGKKYMDSAKAVDSTKQYDAAEALDLVCKNAKAKFDETIEAHIRLGVDSRHADQLRQVRSNIVLIRQISFTAQSVRLHSVLLSLMKTFLHLWKLLLRLSRLLLRVLILSPVQLHLLWA